MTIGQAADDGGPGAGQVVAIVAAAAGGEEAAAGMAVGEFAEAARCVCVRLFGEVQVGNRVTAETVRATLQDDELGPGCVDKGFELLPCGSEHRIVRAGRQRQVQLCADRRPLARFACRTRARVQVPAVLVHVGKDHVRVTLETVEHTIAMVRVDIYVRDAADAVPHAQVFDGDTAVIEDAETRRMIAGGMVEARDRHKSARSVTCHQCIDGRQGRADHNPAFVKDARHHRRVAAVEKTGTLLRQPRDVLDIVLGMKQRERLDGCNLRFFELNPLAQVRPVERRIKGIMAVKAERVVRAKPIGRERITPVYINWLVGYRHVTRLPCLFTSRSIPDNARLSFTWHGCLMAQYIYTMNRVAKVVPPKRFILRDISLSFFPGAKIGVLGLNGSGKSTLLRIMAGLDKEFEGEARPQPGINIGYLPQEPQLDPEKDVRGNVEEGVGELKGLLDRFNEISMKFAEPMDDDEMNALLEEQGKLQDAIDAAGGWEVDRKLDVAADAVRLPPWEADVTKLSGGERRRVALCRLLLSEPDMLLLDEPTNHLDAESVAWLERFLEEYPGTVIAVTHDRYFLDNVAGWILELDRGHGIPWQGNYSSWLEQKEQRLSQEESTEKARRKAMQAELEWVRSNPKGRQAKSKARLRQFEELSSPGYQKRNETNEIYIPPGPRLGDVVLEVSELRKAFGDKLLMDGLEFTLPAGGIAGIIGPNGAGKTTLFRMIIGSEKPDAGTIRVGDSVQIASVDQSRDSLDDNKTVWEEISDGQDIIQVGTYETPSRAYVGHFNFRGADQQQKIGLLSGGERNRVHLAKMLKSGGNLLLLDEPTNDLDVETLRALEQALLEFPGSAIVISHDRWFLDRIATHILAFEGDSEVTWFAGNYTEYEADRKKRLGAEASQPHRIKYRRLDA